MVWLHVRSSVMFLAAVFLAGMGASGIRPGLDTGQGNRPPVGVPRFMLKLKNLSSAARSAAAERRYRQAPVPATLAIYVPAWAVHAVAWPMSVHPGVATSLVAIDAAMSLFAGKSSDTPASFAQVAAHVAAQDPGHWPDSFWRWWAQAWQSAEGRLDQALHVLRGSRSWWDSVVMRLRNQKGGPELEVNFFLVAFVALGMGVVLIAVVIVFALIYKGRVTNNRPHFPETIGNDISMRQPPHDFHFGLFGCCSPSIGGCLYAFCCPQIRHADSLSAAGVMGFWTVFLIFVVIELSSLIIVMATERVTPVFLRFEHQVAMLRVAMCAVAFVPTRIALRHRFGAPETRNVLWDVFFWTCCIPCAIAQEAREVDHAQGILVGCPCTLQHRRTCALDLVGDPVSEMSEDEDAAS